MNSDQAVFLRDFFCNTISNEARTTRKVLASLPEQQKDFRPEPKARTAWELAQHLAGADVWFLTCIANGAFVWSGGGALPVDTVADLVKWYDENLAAAVARMQSLPAADLTRAVDFFGMMTQPACGYLALMSHHSVHHRAQLATYLRPAGATVPAIYGGSADEPM